MRGYEDLKVWQKAMDRAAAVYSIASRMPKTEIYGMVSQLQRPPLPFQPTSRKAISEALERITPALSA